MGLGWHRGNQAPLRNEVAHTAGLRERSEGGQDGGQRWARSLGPFLGGHPAPGQKVPQPGRAGPGPAGPRTLPRRADRALAGRRPGFPLSPPSEDQLPPGFPNIDMGPQLKVVERTRTATMLCAASGNPDPEITWFKDFLPVDPSASNGRIKQLRSGECGRPGGRGSHGGPQGEGVEGVRVEGDHLQG